jgi:hypothetical protein
VIGVETLLPASVIHPESMESLGANWRTTGANALTSAGSATWPADDLALYVPFSLNRPMLAVKVWWFNGATLGADADVGIYSFDGTRLVSAGATAQSGTNQIQIVDITDTRLGAGDFFMGLSLSVATATVLRSTVTGAYLLRALGMFEEAGANPLPATATFATLTQAYIPFFGISGVVTL